MARAKLFPGFLVSRERAWPSSVRDLPTRAVFGISETSSFEVH